MATFETRWLLLVVLLVRLPEILATTGPPAPLSPPRCHVPFDADGRLNIHCVWDPGLSIQIPTNYSLHWKTDDHDEDFIMTGPNVSGIIDRTKFSRHGELSVWVQAKNQYGLVESRKDNINTGNIIQPPPPTITWIHKDTLEMTCNSSCDLQRLCLKSCDVRYRSEGERDWAEINFGSCVNYEFSGPVQPAVIYEFQVRCACCQGLMSEWGASHRQKIPEEAPVGLIDVWRDCGIFPESHDCILIWKRLPLSQANGHILGYEVRLSWANGTDATVNVSTAAPRDQLVCDEKQCYLNHFLKNVLTASVSAYNSRGATSPSHLVIPVQGGEQDNEKAIRIEMNTDNLTVSWDLRPEREYVVQYKQAGRGLGQRIDWVRVKATNAVFKGHFEQYTPYQVSVFTLSVDGRSRRHSSVIGYSLQRTPSKVSSFQVISIAATQATLFWKPPALTEQNGLILHYQIGIAHENVVYNVNASSWHENKTYELRHLHPEQTYVAWIRAVTAAGPGANATTTFITKERHIYLTAAVVPVVLIIIILVGCPLCAWRGEKACPLVSKYLNVPDPHNSHIFKHMKHQMNDSSVCVCAPICESQPEISILEVVEVQETKEEPFPQKHSQSEPDRPATLVAGCSQADCQDEQREECEPTEHRYRREQYSKMVDSDEENDEEDCWDLSAEQPFTSGYEKHFMPTTQEVMQC